jgi:hypothetical protein
VDFHFPWQHSLFDPSVAFQIFSTDGSAIEKLDLVVTTEEEEMQLKYF